MVLQSRNSAGKITTKITLPIKRAYFSQGIIWASIAQLHPSPKHKEPLSARRKEYPCGVWREPGGGAGRTGRATPFIVFRCFARTPQRFYKSVHLDCLQNNGADSFAGFKGLSAPTRFGRPLWSWPRYGSLMDNTCTVAALPMLYRPKSSIPLKPSKLNNSLESIQPCPLTQADRGIQGILFYPSPFCINSRFQCQNLPGSSQVLRAELLAPFSFRN